MLKQSVDKNSINRLLKKLRDTGTVNRLACNCILRSAALKKVFNWLTIWFWVEKIRHRLTERSVKSHARQAFG